MPARAGLVAAALSAQLGVEIKSEKDATQLSEQKPGQVQLVRLSLSNLFSHTHNVVKTDDAITVRILGRGSVEYPVDAAKSVQDIAKTLAAKIGIHPGSQTLVLHRGRRLANDQSLGAQNIPAGSSLLLAWGPGGDGPEPVHYIKDDDLDPQFDYDFTNVTDDGKKFERGGHEYKRPCGWDRCALKVLGRYDDDVWLGTLGTRTWSSTGEWAVSYHGTGVDIISPIAKDGYIPSKSGRFGPGIYSSPSLQVVSQPRYAKEFTYKGKRYLVVLQNRVNLAESEVISAARTRDHGAEYFRTPTKKNIRAYGVCLKEI